MKRLLAVLILFVLAFAPAVRAQDEGPDELYIKIYGLMQRGDQLQAKGRTADAAAKYFEAQTDLKKIRADFPEWNPKVVKYRLEFLSTKLSAMGIKSNALPSAAMIEGPADPVELKLKWEVGKRYVQRSDMTQNVETSVGGQTQKQVMKVATDTAVSAIKETEGGGRELELEYIAFAMNMSAGPAELKFDSHQPADQDGGNPVAGVFRKIIGAHIKFVTDADGKVTSVQGADELIDRIVGDSSPEAKAMLKGLISSDNIKQMSPSGLGLPGKPVKTGDTWPMKSEVNLGPLGGAMVMNLNYTLKGWELHDNHKCAVLEFTGDIGSKPAEGDDAPASKVTFEGGKISGKTWFDAAMGMGVETQGDQDMSLKMTVQGASVATKLHQLMGNKLVEVANIAK